MRSTNRCLKEWNATIEALGHGKQTILIRNYETNITGFLLYPTMGYALKDDYLHSFQNKYKDFVRNNALPSKKDDEVLIKYFSMVEDIIKKPISKIPTDKNYIWTKTHVKNYVTGKTPFIWVLRVYKLKEPYWAPPTHGAIRFANLKEEVSLDGMESVLSDSEFAKFFKAVE